MSFRFLSIVLLCSAPASARILRVCADPNNLPFSNKAGEGFENRLAELVARHLGAALDYTWWPERKSFVEKSLNQGNCDLLLGVPSQLASVRTTRPYYRSTYVFVSRKDRHLRVSSLLDAALEKYRIGIQVVGDNYAPPAQLLARRGLTANLVGYSLFGNAGEPNPGAGIIAAVDRGDVDIAIVWGPFAGYFAKHNKIALVMAPVAPAAFAGVPFMYDISLAVRKQDAALATEVDQALARNCEAITSLLTNYGIPQVPEGGLPCESSQASSASSH